MRLIKAVLAYNGSFFHGWQVQKSSPTVQAAVEKALAKIHGRAVKVCAASRTDSGVHAQGQVIHFHSDARLSDRELRKALDHHLPPAISVLSLRTPDRPFHARFDAKGKLYRYTIYNGKRKPLFKGSCVSWIPYGLNIRKMRKAASVLAGKHDFTSFASPNGTSQRKVRTLQRLIVKRSGDDVIIEARGDGFLMNMLRIIVGTLVEVGRNKLHPEEMERILEARDRKAAGHTADSRGLMLVKVYY